MQIAFWIGGAILVLSIAVAVGLRLWDTYLFDPPKQPMRDPKRTGQRG